MITESCWNGAASGRFSGVGRSVPYAMGVFGNQRELAGNDAFPCGAGRSPPPTRESKVSATTRASGAQRSVCGAVARGGAESEQRSSPKCPATPDNPSVSLRLTAPFAQGSLGDGGCGLPRRFAPRNDSPDPLSFREGPTGRRGNPSFLRWPWVRAVVPRAWPPPTKFRPEIWGVGQVVGPYGRSAGVPATGRCRHRPLRNEAGTAATSRAAL